MLEEVNIQLAALKRHLINAKDKYQRQINAAQSAGFMEDYTDEIKLRYQQFSLKIDSLTLFIERNDAKIDDQKEFIRQLQEYSRNNT